MFFPSFSAKIPETPSTFRVAALCQIAKTFTMEESFSSFRASVRLFRRAAALESKSDRIEGRRERARRGRAPESALTLRSGATCVVESAK